MSGDWAVIEGNPLGISPQVGRVIAVGKRLAVVAKEEVETLGVRIAGAAHRAQAPLADGPRGITRFPEDLGDCQCPSTERILPLCELGKGLLGLDVAADLGMAHVAAGQQHATRWRTDGSSTVVAGEAHALRGQPVEVGCWDLLLAIATQLPPTEVVGKDEDHVEGPLVRADPGRLCPRGSGFQQPEDRQGCEKPQA